MPKPLTMEVAASAAIIFRRKLMSLIVKSGSGTMNARNAMGNHSRPSIGHPPRYNANAASTGSIMNPDKNVTSAYIDARCSSKGAD